MLVDGVCPLTTDKKGKKMKRSGLITTKIGMTRLYDEGGVAHAVTVLSVGDCAVIGNRTTEKNGYVVPSLAFFHIPFEEYGIAYNLYKQGSGLVTHHYGENREGIACSRKESQMFEKMVELGSTKACFVGHDHINNSDITYQGIELVFGIKATDRVYADKDMMGGLTITIHDDNSYTIDRIYHTYEEVK